MNTASENVVFVFPQPRTNGVVAAAFGAMKALLAHVRETGLDRTHAADDLPAMDARLLRDIGVEAAWRPALYREFQYPRL